MSSCRDALIAVAVALLASATPAAAKDYAGIGRPATAKEIAAWNIDVRPDFQGLPKGSGSVARGQDIWESKCATCHGIFGESREVFSPLVGGTTKADIETGRVARLTDPAYPERTMMMRLNTVSTLWDFINRAMPWTAPKSLSTDEVYSVTAYILNMAGVLPDDFVLSDRNIAEAQKRLPNRNGMTTQHGMWPGKEFGNGKPDVQGSSCMQDCVAEPKVASLLPDFARNAHGNLADQNRLIGAQHGADTTRPPPSSLGAGTPVSMVKAASTAPAGPTASPSAKALGLLQGKGCTACHGVDNKIVGPAFRDVAAKYANRADGVAYLVGKIRSGGSGTWGSIPMPPQTLSDTEVNILAQWLMDGARK